MGQGKEREESPFQAHDGCHFLVVLPKVESVEL